METILVPTDFSESASNAARYAIALAGSLKATKVVFFNAYQLPPIINETTVPAMPIIDIDTMKSISEQGMKNFCEKFQKECPEGITLEPKTDFSILAQDINEICRSTGAGLIVMGITGTSRIEEVLIGSTAINVVKHTKVPVVVVPGEATFTSINNVMLASDYKNVVETTPVDPIKNILDATGASLFIVNVSESDKEVADDKTHEKELLQSLLANYNPIFKFVNNADFIEGINQFVEANSIDLIIAIPRKHKFFEGLFKERHSKKLAFHSHVPLMYIHDEDL